MTDSPAGQSARYAGNFDAAIAEIETRELKHTKGPWTMEVVRTSVGVCFKVGPFPWKQGKLNHACIYADYPSGTDYAECEANARLIAAAPELLEAAQIGLAFALVKFGNLDPDANAAFDRIRAAIAKATGPALPA